MLHTADDLNLIHGGRRTDPQESSFGLHVRVCVRVRVRAHIHTHTTYMTALHLQKKMDANTYSPLENVSSGILDLQVV